MECFYTIKKDRYMRILVMKVALNLKKSFVYLIFMVFLMAGCTSQNTAKSVYWPQSSGPNADWTIETSDVVPYEFSVRTGKNILWTMDLPEVGQGGITVWKDKIFLTVMKPIHEELKKKELKTSTILALCIDAKKQEILWQKELHGTAKSPYFYGFSDSTTPAPVTDGNYVWFFNSSGQIACFEMEGKQVWERNWKPIEQLGEIHYPFNKQFEPILHNNALINMETYWKKDSKRIYGHNYLYGLDKMTGEELWISEESLTHYNTPVFNTTEFGESAMLIGRGAHHKVPESPKGYSLVNLNTGKSIWQYKTKEGMAMYNSVWTQDYALWFTEQENLIHKIDAKTGKLLEKISLISNVDLRTYDTIKQQYKLHKNINLSDSPNVFPAWYTNIIVNNKCYFMCFKANNAGKLKQPEYTFGCLDLATAKVEYLEVPAQYELVNGKKNYLWHIDLKTETKNIRELDVALDQRSKKDGWAWNFNANPILVNEKLFYTTQSGLVYCFDTSRTQFDEKSLLSVNDLGPKGKTWTLNTPSYSEGKIYHRTSKQLICIEMNSTE